MRGNPTLSFRMIVSLGNVLKGHGFTVYGKTRFRQGFEGAQLYRLRKDSFPSSFVSGHDFSRADKSFVFDSPSGRQSARRVPFGLFPQPVKPNLYDARSGTAKQAAEKLVSEQPCIRARLQSCR